MANRVFDDAGALDRARRRALDAEIAELEGRRPDAQRRARARRLFARALETPGGLKVQTIHAFCTRLLHQFPFEADVAARFEVLDERTQTELLDRLALDVLLEAAAKPGQRRSAGRSRPRSRRRPTRPSRDVVREAIAQARRRSTAGSRTRAASTAAIDGTVARARARAGRHRRDASRRSSSTARIIPRHEWPAVIAALARQARRTTASRPSGFDAQRADERRDADRRLSVDLLHGRACEPRKNVVTKAHRENASRRLPAPRSPSRTRVCALLERRRAVDARDRTARAASRIAHAVIARYRAEKAGAACSTTTT